MKPNTININSGWSIELFYHKLAKTNSHKDHDLPRAKTKNRIGKITRFTLESFELADDGVAEWFGLELAQIVVNQCLGL